VKTRMLIGMFAFMLLASFFTRAGVDPSVSYRLSGPYIVRNLQVFLVHGPDRVPRQRYLTLGEAMKTGKVVVHETGNVQKLRVENHAGLPVSIQSGDIVKGGRQDRVISLDLIVPPGKGGIPLDAFCVESGRWSKRGDEQASRFASNAYMLSSRGLRLAAKQNRKQGEVWANVASQQARLNENVRKLSGKAGADVRANASASSLQLSMENDDLQELVRTYTGALEGILDGRPDVIGFAFTLDGEANNAEVYGRSDLFRALWPKLLHAAAVEAIAAYRGPEPTAPVVLLDERMKAVRGVTAMLAGALNAAPAVRDVAERTRLITREAGSLLLFETRDRAQAGAWIHRNHVHKPAAAAGKHRASSRRHTTPTQPAPLDGFQQYRAPRGRPTVLQLAPHNDDPRLRQRTNQQFVPLHNDRAGQAQGHR